MIKSSIMNWEDARKKSSVNCDPGPDRLRYVADAFRNGMILEEVHEASKIDPWFLAQIEDLVLTEKTMSTKTLTTLKEGELYRINAKAFLT